MATSPQSGPRSYALAAVLLMENRPGEAFAAVDPVAEHADSTDAALVRVLRMLALTALGQPERAAAEFDARRLAAAAQWPSRGPRWWFTSRGCDNAFIGMRTGALVAKAEAILQKAGGAGGRPELLAVAPATSPSAAPAAAAPVAAPASTPMRFRPRPLLVVRSTARSAFVDLDRSGRARAAAPKRLQLLDEHGVRIGWRVAVRKTCASTCGEAGDRQCHVIGEYRYRGPPIARFAVALPRRARVEPRPIDRAPMARPTQLAHLEQLFRTPVAPPVESEVIFSWARAAGSDDWAEQSASRVDMGPSGARPLAVQATGTRFAACSLATYAELTEFSCPDRRSAYLRQRHLGGSGDRALGSLLRYAADIDGKPVYFVIVEWNSVQHLRLVFWRPDGWHEVGVDDDRTVC